MGRITRASEVRPAIAMPRGLLMRKNILFGSYRRAHWQFILLSTLSRSRWQCPGTQYFRKALAYNVAEGR